jgi:hypothetical protein
MNTTKTKQRVSAKQRQAADKLLEGREALEGLVCYEWMPKELVHATKFLMGLQDEGFNALVDDLCNDAHETFPAIWAALQLCRGAVDDLESVALEVLAHDAKLQREKLAKLDGLGVV